MPESGMSRADLSSLASFAVDLRYPGEGKSPMLLIGLTSSSQIGSAEVVAIDLNRPRGSVKTNSQDELG